MSLFYSKELKQQLFGYADAGNLLDPHNVRPDKIPIFLKKGKIVISVKNQNFSRSWMMKWISPLESSREI